MNTYHETSDYGYEAGPASMFGRVTQLGLINTIIFMAVERYLHSPFSENKNIYGAFQLIAKQLEVSPGLVESAFYEGYENKYSEAFKPAQAGH